MTKGLKRHKQVGEHAGGGQRAGKYKREEARLQRAEMRRQRARLPRNRGEEGWGARPHLGRTPEEEKLVQVPELKE